MSHLWVFGSLVLQFNDLKADQRKKPCIRVNTRELSIGLSILYTNNG